MSSFNFFDAVSDRASWSILFTCIRNHLSALYKDLWAVFTRSYEALAEALREVHAFGSVPRLLVEGPRGSIPFRDLELDLSISVRLRPRLRLPEEELSDAAAAVVRRHPDVIHEAADMRGEEGPQLSDDHVPEEPARFVLGDEPRPLPPLDERPRVLAELRLERPAIEVRLLVLGDVRPHGLHRRLPDHGLIGLRGGSPPAPPLPGPPAPPQARRPRGPPPLSTPRAPSSTRPARPAPSALETPAR